MRIKQAFAAQLPFFIAVPALVWQILFLYAPLGFLVVSSFFHTGQPWTFATLTLANYRALCTWAHVHVVGVSLFVAFLNAFLCLLIAYPVAYFLAFRVTRFKNLFLFLLTLPFWTNFLVQAYAWFFLLEKHGVVNNVLASLGFGPFSLLYNQFSISLVLLYCYLPFVIMPLYSVLEKFDQEVLLAARDLGASTGQMVRHVLLPLTRDGMRTGFILVFIPSFGEYVVPLLLGGNKYLYAGSLIAEYFIVARDSSLGSAFVVVVLLLVTGISAGIMRFMRSPQALVEGRMS